MGPTKRNLMVKGRVLKVKIAPRDLHLRKTTVCEIYSPTNNLQTRGIYCVIGRYGTVNRQTNGQIHGGDCVSVNPPKIKGWKPNQNRTVEYAKQTDTRRLYARWRRSRKTRNARSQFQGTTWEANFYEMSRPGGNRAAPRYLVGR